MRQFLDILLDGASILSKVKSLRLERRRDQAVDVLTLELGEYSLYSQFDFGTVPTAERIQVATAKADPKTDGSTSASTVFTSASSGFVADAVTIDDLLLILTSAIAADIGTWPITVVATTQLTTSHTFGTGRGIEFVVLKNQGRFFVEKPDVLEDKNQVSIPSLWGRCGLARMTDPFAGKITRSYSASTTFHQLTKDFVSLCGMDNTKVQFDIDDFSIPANIYSVSNQYPLQIVIDLASKSNGFVRCDKNGNLWVQRDLYHFDALPIAQALGDNEIVDMREALEYPQFGNRILVHSSVSSAGMNVRVRLKLDTRCIRGNGTASTKGEAIVTDGADNPVSDGIPVDWAIDNPNLATWGPALSLTAARGISSELKAASDLNKVNADYPIREVLGVYLENDSNRAVNYYTGGSFQQSQMTLGQDLPFTDSRVLVDYIAAGIAVSTLQSVAGAPETKTFVHASVGKIRDSQEFCINNNLNVSISLKASKTEYNLCTGEQAAISDVVGQVKIDGDPGNGAMIDWSRVGDALGSLTPKFSTVKNLAVEETTTSANNFTVNTQNEIASVTGIWLVASGKTGTNYYSAEQNRKKSFTGTEITLGTNLPDARMAVIVDYVAIGAVQAQYTGPQQIGKDKVTATLQDGTSKPASGEVDIDAINSCTGASGAAGSPAGAKDCSKSAASAQNCAGGTYPNAIDANQTECICRRETGGACPTNDADCQKLCQDLIRKYGVDVLDCDPIPSRIEILDVQNQLHTVIPPGQEAAYVSCAKTCNGDPDCIAQCVSDYPQATQDRCAKTCNDHGVQISPKSGSINCSGAKKITFTASGGTPPYSWSATGGSLAISGVKAETADLTPPANFGGAVAGDAYQIYTPYTNHARTSTWGCETVASISGVALQNYGCGDVAGTCNPAGSSAQPITVQTPGFSTDDVSDLSCNLPVHADGCAGLAATKKYFVDTRSPSMIAAGCQPCGVAFQAGAVVTVKDSKGKSAGAVVTQ